MAKKKDNTQFFLLGASIVDSFNSDGYLVALDYAKGGADFQIANFNPDTDRLIDFLNEILGQDDVVELSKEQYLEFLKIQTNADNLLSYKKEY